MTYLISNLFKGILGMCLRVRQQKLPLSNQVDNCIGRHSPLNTKYTPNKGDNPFNTLLIERYHNLKCQLFFILKLINTYPGAAMITFI